MYGAITSKRVMIMSNRRSRGPCSGACRFDLGQHFGIDLGLKGLEHIRLAGEVAAKVGKAEPGAVGDCGKRHGAPAALRGDLKRRAHGFVAFAELVEHGVSPLPET